ncbi:MAG TPA: signal peptidase II [Hyphomonadaceae bacterium]|nr:signal peptidase II [Hyphomonadaceae bacterium]
MSWIDYFRRRGVPHALMLALVAFAVVLVLDQASKWWVVEGLNLKERGVIPVLSPFLTFQMAWNDGVNFGLLGGNPGAMRIPLIVLSLCFTVTLIAFARGASNRVQAIALGVAAGGALGNAIDRMTRGAVADFLNMSCCSLNNPWSFNVADIAIFAGLGVAVLCSGKKSQPA